MPDQEVETQVVEAQETPEETPTGEEDRGANLRGLDAETLVSMVLNLRDENASTRRKKSAAEQKLAEDARAWQQHLDSQKSEAQRAADRAAALEEELSKFRTKEKRDAIVKKIDGFPMDLIDLVVGDEDQMKATAKRLAEREKTLRAGDVSVHAGNRGVPVQPTNKGGGGFLEDLDPQRRK